VGARVDYRKHPIVDTCLSRIGRGSGLPLPRRRQTVSPWGHVFNLPCRMPDSLPVGASFQLALARATSANAVAVRVCPRPVAGHSLRHPAFAHSMLTALRHPACAGQQRRLSGHGQPLTDSAWRMNSQRHARRAGLAPADGGRPRNVLRTGIRLSGRHDAMFFVKSAGRRHAQESGEFCDSRAVYDSSEGLP
jgi:hypothetical protein